MVFQNVSVIIIHQDVNMTKPRVMVSARIVLVSPLVTHVTNVCLTTMKCCYPLTIQIDVKVSCGLLILNCCAVLCCVVCCCTFRIYLNSGLVRVVFCTYCCPVSGVVLCYVGLDWVVWCGVAVCGVLVGCVELCGGLFSSVVWFWNTVCCVVLHSVDALYNVVLGCIGLS